MTGRRRTTRLAAAGTAALLVLTGCGSEDTPSSAVPALSTRLVDIDSAIVDGRYAVARDELESLGEDTAAAVEGGDLDQAQAERILDAIQALVEALPVPSPAETPTEDATEEPTDDASEGETDDDEADDEETGSGKPSKPPKGSKGPQGKGQKGR
ncbi:hypothetical protein NPS01_34440 [Nocardioides psychrotolerans]|uniref:Uncharacterized protein n=1 Tax=Nocardioides psychrotolerans TaxID=1005945 RepID=A0A1I3CCW3_9ACTN|nr:hypothetical protein [Nocardioides psychrotolerans]GEP39781.1 hypothetical protein NPS01_34440 [Nocardioides psychrotolerans]SFH72317.1 hypothetical protein SAMN05216561_1024 [Nocardioides psychrotolerans]